MSNRRQRRLDHIKTQKGDIGKGFPSKQEARQGHTVTKYLDGQGLFEFTYFNNQWYKKKLETASQVDMTTSGKITTSELVIDEGGTADFGPAKIVGGIKAEQIVNTPYAGTVTPSYIGGAIGNLKLTQPVTEKGQIGFDNSTNSFEFKQSANDKIVYDGSTFKSTRNVIDGNPTFQVGSSDTECLKMSAIYKSGEKGLSSATIETLTADNDPDEGFILFKVDSMRRMQINDDDLSLFTPGAVTADKDALIIENLANAASMTNTRTSILFNQYYYDGTPAAADAAKITVGTVGNWNATASNQDAYMSFSVALNGTMSEYMKVGSDGVVKVGTNQYLGLSDNQIDVSSGDLKLDSAGDIIIDAAGTEIFLRTAGTTYGKFSSIASTLSNMTLYERGGATTDDLFAITVLEHGNTLIFTTDASGASGAHLTINPQGNLNLQNAVFKNAATFEDDVTFEAAITFEDDLTTEGDLVIKADGSNYTTLSCAADGHLSITGTGTDDDFSLDFDGSITIDGKEDTFTYKDNGTSRFSYNSGAFIVYGNSGGVSDFCMTDVNANGETQIATSDSDGDVGHLSIDVQGNITLNSTTGNFIAEKSGAEFSAANSAYAGMILGYTMIGDDDADDAYILTTSFVCFQDSGGTEISVAFTTPPSENVEIEVELYFSAGSGASDLFLTVSNHGSYASNSLHHQLQHEKVVVTPSRGWGGTVTQKFYLNANHLAAVGSGNIIYIAAKTDSTSGGPIIKWGGNATGDPTNLVMKATALPVTLGTGS